MAINPIDFTFTLSPVPENLPAGTVVAEIAISEPVDGEVTYVIEPGFYDWSENEIPTDAFKLVGTRIVTTKPLDFEYVEDNYYHIEIKVRAYVDGELFISSGGYSEELLNVTLLDIVENIQGTSKADILKGASGRDKFLAGAGDDKLYGYRGDDILYGSLGQDTLSGGRGADTFLFKSIKESTVKAPDIIVDWEHEAGSLVRDLIDLKAIDANTKLAGNQEFDWIGAKKFTGHAGELRYEKLKSEAYVYADVNGDKKADFAIHITKSTKMYMDDFLL